MQKTSVLQYFLTCATATIFIENTYFSAQSNGKRLFALLTSDFPSENPRTQTNTFHTRMYR
ncbi:hypothetical protein GCM10022397_16680 [Flavivirga jejuensis]